MMAPERYEEAAATTAPVSSGIADAAQPGSAVSDGRAPPWWLSRSRERARKAAKEAEKSQTSRESSARRARTSDGTAEVNGCTMRRIIRMQKSRRRANRRLPLMGLPLPKE